MVFPRSPVTMILKGMLHTLLKLLVLVFCFGPHAQADPRLAGYFKRFEYEHNSKGEVIALRLKNASKRISVLLLLDQIKHDFMNEQQLLDTQEPIELLSELGNTEEINAVNNVARKLKDISIAGAFDRLKKEKFWKKIEKKANKALLSIDPSYLANLEDPRFFYKRRVKYELTQLALDFVHGVFLDVPVLHMARFIVRRIQWMMLEQIHFHQSMVIYYLEHFTPSQLGLTQSEANRLLSSIYEYRIHILKVRLSINASNNWEQFGLRFFQHESYIAERNIKAWSKEMGLREVEALSFGFVRATDERGLKIYHTQVPVHLFGKRPALAFDYEKPDRIRKMRAVLNMAGLALGFIPIPAPLIKDGIYLFLESLYIDQVRLEGALVAHFESQGDLEMMRRIYAQRANYYILE
jgi:hypothetical protein